MSDDVNVKTSKSFVALFRAEPQGWVPELFQAEPQDWAQTAPIRVLFQVSQARLQLFVLQAEALPRD